MFRVLFIVIILLTGLIFAPELSDNKGYLLISFDSYTTYKTTIINAGGIVLVFYFLLLATEWILRKLLSMTSLTRGWFGQRKTRKAQKNSLLGMLALLEGNTKQAQKLLSKSASQSEAPALNYIAAARASHQNNNFNQRDDYLQLANKGPGCKLAVGLVWVELQLDAKQHDNALVTLNNLEQKFPKNRKIFQYYLSVYPALNEWKKLISLINSNRKLIGLIDPTFSDLELLAHQKFFQQLALESGDQLNVYWNKNIARGVRKDISYQKAMLSAFIDSDNGKLALSFLVDQLQGDAFLPLLSYLKQIQAADYSSIINLLENKLKKSEHIDSIHQALGYLKSKDNKADEAIKHFVESIKSLKNTEDYQLLASLLVKQERFDEANLYYRQGLEFATSSS